METTRNRWLPEDDDMLREAYTKAPPDLPGELLVRHSTLSCRNRAHDLMLTKPHRRRGFMYESHFDPSSRGWMAGLVDGEGHVGFDRRGLPVIKITTTSPEIVAKVKELVPTFNLYERRPTATGKACWALALTSRHACARLAEDIGDLIIIESKREAMRKMAANE